MQDPFVPILLGLVCLLLIAIVLIDFLVYKYYALKAQSQARIHEEYRKQTEIAMRKAQEQLQKWREQELEQSRKQQLETARIEMKAEFEKWKSEYEKQIRQDAIQRSQSVITGKITEHLVPYLPDFQYNPKDARFIGSPIDLIIFDGLNDSEVRQIVFAEIKTGASSLNDRERQVRNAVQAGRVKWIEIRPSIKTADAAMPIQ